MRILRDMECAGVVGANSITIEDRESVVLGEISSIVGGVVMIHGISTLISTGIMLYATQKLLRTQIVTAIVNIAIGTSLFYVGQNWIESGSHQ